MSETKCVETIRAALKRALEITAKEPLGPSNELMIAASIALEQMAKGTAKCESPVRKALERIISARVPCPVHKPLRFPLCWRCQLDAPIEEAEDALEADKGAIPDPAQSVTSPKGKF